MYWRVKYWDAWGYPRHYDFETAKEAWSYYSNRSMYDDSVQEPVQISIFDIIEGNR